MMIIIIIFLVIFLYEWKYLKDKHRKKRTYWIVFSVMAASFMYCIATVIFNQMPSINYLLELLLKPLQQKILG